MENVWKIVYSCYENEEKRAVDLLYKEAGRLLLRDWGVYSIYVLPCEKEGCALAKNSFIVGTFDESPLIRSFVKEDEIKEKGFMIKIVENPQDSEGQIIIFTAKERVELYYAVAHFFDYFVAKYAPRIGNNRMPDHIFDNPLPKITYTEEPDNDTRSVFTWGHSINDYRAYIENMARLKLNELIMWNDYVPVNIKEVIDYAHSFGIRVVLGYSWGWKDFGEARLLENITDEQIDKMKASVVEEYRNIYAPIGCDGIYFQSFTECKNEMIGGRLIARLVTDTVNDIASRLLEITPSLRLIFGLHATSVKDRLEEIARVDERIEILWEDCGSFPYAYEPWIESEEAFNNTLEFTKKLLTLRNGKGVGLVFKGVMMMDWWHFIYQYGPYIIGGNSEDIKAHDRKIRERGWRIYSGEWAQHGKWAHKLYEFVKNNKISQINTCIAGTFDGGIYLPVAASANMLRSLSPYDETLKKVTQAPFVELG